MKIISAISITCLVFLPFSGFPDDKKEAKADVVEELSEEAAILRALVEEYKAKAAKTIPPTPIPESTEAEEFESTLKNSVVEQIGKVDKIPAEEVAPRMSLPEPPRADPPLSSLAREVKEVIQPDSSTPEVTVPTFKPREVAVPTFKPRVLTPKSESPLERLAREEAAAKKKAAESISSATDLISNPIESATSVISESAANTEPPKMKEGLGTIGSITIEDPQEAPEISSVPPPLKVTTDVPDITTTEKIAASTSGPGPDSIILNDNPEVAKVGGEVEQEVEMVAVEKPDGINPASSSNGNPTARVGSENKPLVVATKRKATEKPVSNPEDEVSLAAAATEPVEESASPAATARSVTPLKDLGRMLFGPRDGGPRGPIFKRRAKGAAPR